MKRFLLYAMSAVMLFSCSDEYDDSSLWNSVNSLEGRVAQLEQLCKQMNTNISSLQTLVTAVQQNDYVKSVTPVSEGGKTIGYTITFTKSAPITIYHGKDGEKGDTGATGATGQDGHAPVIGVKQDTDGIYYWTLDGEWLTDEGNKIKAQGTDGKDGEDGKPGADGQPGTPGEDGDKGQDGKDGITPKLKIENDYWFISYDNEESWTQLGKATGEDGQDGQDGKPGADGQDGDPMFADVDYTSSPDYVIFTLLGGTQIKLPTWSAFEALKALCDEMNTNISALHTLVTALQGNDYVTAVMPVMQEGKEIGYTITFSKSRPITIYHGKNGENGQDGEDGKDGADGEDGSTPIVGVKQDTDGIYYWTLNGEWLTDDAGMKVKAQGTDGQNGSDGNNGQDGVNGKDGVTPKLKIEEGYWFISYDNEESWTQLGKATGEDGKDGQDGQDGQDGAPGADGQDGAPGIPGTDGKDGDSMFTGVDYKTNPDYVIFTLADETQIKLPTWSAFETLKTLCNQMNTNISSLQNIVTALQSNDYVKSVAPIMQGGKEVGYTITFGKSSPITIYHGKDGEKGETGATGQDGHTPVIGVKQDTDGIYYWTLDGEWLTDDAGAKIKAQGTDGQNGSDGNDGQDGTNGQDGITPKLKIENGYWFISYDNEGSWTQLGKATGEDGKDGQDGQDGAPGADGQDGAPGIPGTDGKDGDSMFSGVDYTSSKEYVIFTLSDGTQLQLPTWSAFVTLRLLCNEMNTNISALQTLVTALQENDYIKSVAPLMQGGKEVGYTITFGKSSPITLYHGKDGEKGETGATGQDGHTPVIGVKQDTDGIYYWTLDGEWLTDDAGAKIKAQGTDGQNGSDGNDGQDGTNGQDGITPKLKIENGYWYISYNNEQSWTQLGKATGEDGKDGQDGAPGTDGQDGDSMFSDIQIGKTSVTFVQSNGISFTVPLGKTFSFEIQNSADTQPFDYSEVKTYDVVTENVVKLSISKPNGWTAAIKDNILKITAPTLSNYNAEQTGTVSVIAVNDAGQSIIQNVDVTIQSEYIYIIDDDFRNYCLSLCDSNKDGMITKTEAESVTEMVIPAEVQSVQGIEYFTKLSSLNIRNTSLKALDASKNTELTYININLALVSLDVSGCLSLNKIEGTRETSLEYLNLGNTNPLYVGSSGTIDYLEIAIAHGSKFKIIGSKLTKIRYYSTNIVTEIDISECPALEDFYCDTWSQYPVMLGEKCVVNARGCSALKTFTIGSKYKVTDINVSGCTSLISLSCSENQLTSLELSGCAALTSLSCSSNQLTSLDVSDCTALTTLYCNSNQLTSLKLSGCVALTSLSCSSNQLTSLDVSDCTTLTSLYCNSNQLTSLDVSKNVKLKTLNCSSNNLTSLDVSKTNLGNSSDTYPLDCAPMGTLQTLYLKTGWRINGVNYYRSSSYVPSQTEILFKD